MTFIALPDDIAAAQLEQRILDTAVKLLRSKKHSAKRLLRTELHALVRLRTPERVAEIELANLQWSDVL